MVEFTLDMPHFVAGDYFFNVAIALGNTPHHVQLKWYDALVPIVYLKGEREVYGLLGVDYDMTLVEETEGKIGAKG